jgi:hypothetical protein
MSNEARESSTDKQGPGKRRQSWTERQARRAVRACPDRVLRILPDGTFELRPAAGEAQQEKEKDDWENI